MLTIYILQQITREIKCFSKIPHHYPMHTGEKRLMLCSNINVKQGKGLHKKAEKIFRYHTGACDRGQSNRQTRRNERC